MNILLLFVSFKKCVRKFKNVKHKIKHPHYFPFLILFREEKVHVDEDSRRRKRQEEFDKCAVKAIEIEEEAWKKDWEGIGKNEEEFEYDYEVEPVEKKCRVTQLSEMMENLIVR